jgi:predicted permease
MSSWMETLRSAIRSFRNRKMFALVTVLLLSLALAATNIMFTLIDAVLLRPLPFTESQRLAWLTSVRPDRDDGPFSMPDFRDLRDRNQTAELAAVSRWSAILSGSGPADRLQGVRATANLFQLLGVRPEAGRLLVPADDEEADRRVVVITNALWRTRFGGDRGIVGQTVTLDNRAYEIVGVLPATFQLPVYADAGVFGPLAPEFHPSKATRNSVNFLSLIGRPKPGVTIEQMQADLSGVARQMASEFPETNGRKLAVKATPLQQRYTGNVRSSLLILLAAVLMVLLIACANLANLVLIQLAARESELAIRTALGATRLNIVRQLAAENLLLALSGGLLAFVATRSAVPVLMRFLPTQMPRSGEIGVAGQVFLFSLAMAALSALLFGVLPALHWRAASGGLLGSGRSSSTSMRGTQIRNVISAGQIAVSVVLLISTALLAKSFLRLQDAELGFEPASVLTARVSLPMAGYKSAADIVRFSDSFREKLAATPGVVAVGMTNVLPLSGVIASIHFSTEGPVLSQGNAPLAQFRVVTPDYFRSMGMSLEGRDFADQDASGSEPVAIINRELATRYFSAGNALGTRLTFEHFGDAGQQTVRVVGIAANVKHFAIDETPSFDIYIPLRQINEGVTPWLAGNHFWVIRTSVKPSALRDQVRATLAGVDKGAGASEVEGMDWYLRSALSVRRFNLALIAAFGLTSLLLAVTGVYAVLSYSLALRRREIGTRIALGASPTQILQMVLAQAARLIAAGLIVGAAAALGLTQVMRGLLFGVRATDPAAFSGVCIVVFVAALLSCFLPAVRASRTDPITVLRAG